MRLSKHAKASLREFILKPEINFAIEQALQQNETMDVFARDFDKLGRSMSIAPDLAELQW